MGVDPTIWAPVERWIREDGKLSFIQGNKPDVIDMASVQYNPETVAILDAETSRFGDQQQWMIQVDEWLKNEGNYAVSAVVNEDDLVLAVITA
jgi:hypothetical protein